MDGVGDRPCNPSTLLSAVAGTARQGGVCCVQKQILTLLALNKIPTDVGDGEVIVTAVPVRLIIITKGPLLWGDFLFSNDLFRMRIVLVDVEL